MSKPWNSHGPYQKRACQQSPDGKHCFCVSSSVSNDHATTRTSRCCWCNETKSEVTQAAPGGVWTASDAGHGIHRKIVPQFSGAK